MGCEVQAPSAVNGIDAFFKYAPLVVVVLIIVLALMFDVEKKNPQN